MALRSRRLYVSCNSARTKWSTSKPVPAPRGIALRLLAALAGARPRSSSRSVSGAQRAGVAVGPGGRGDVDAELVQLGGDVVEHPLLEDLVVPDDAVGDHPAVDLAARRRAPAPGAGVVADVERPVRGDEALLVVARPDHVVGVVAHVGEGADPLDRARRPRLDAVPRAAVVVDAAAGA